MNLASLESDVKAGLAKIGHLLYTPQTTHPVLEELRQVLGKEIQAHLSNVANGVLALGNSVLQQVEQSVNPTASAPAASAKPATPVASPAAKE